VDGNGGVAVGRSCFWRSTAVEGAESGSEYQDKTVRNSHTGVRAAAVVCGAIARVIGSNVEAETRDLAARAGELGSRVTQIGRMADAIRPLCRWLSPGTGAYWTNVLDTLSHVSFAGK